MPTATSKDSKDIINTVVCLKRTAVFSVLEAAAVNNSSGSTQLQQQERTMKRKRGPDFLELLPDALLVEVAEYLLDSASDLVRFQRVNKRTHKLLTQESIVQELLAKAEQPQVPDHALPGISLRPESLEQLAFYQAVKRGLDLLEDNRIGFDYASLEMDDDDDGHSGIQKSRTRVEKLRRFLRKNQFPTLRVSVQGHCGTGAPAGIAPRFSAARGHYVATALTHDYEEGEEEEFVVRYHEDETGRIVVQFGQNDDESDSDDDDDSNSNEGVNAESIRNRIEVNAWGRRVAFAARASSHPYSEVAKEGKGWVELYVKLGHLELPAKPDYYGTWSLHTLNTW